MLVSRLILRSFRLNGKRSFVAEVSTVMSRRVKEAQGWKLLAASVSFYLLDNRSSYHSMMWKQCGAEEGTDHCVPADGSAKRQDVFQASIVPAFVIGISSEALKALILTPNHPFRAYTRVHIHTHTHAPRINSKEVPAHWCTKRRSDTVSRESRCQSVSATVAVFLKSKASGALAPLARPRLACKSKRRRERTRVRLRLCLVKTREAVIWTSTPVPANGALRFFLLVVVDVFFLFVFSFEVGLVFFVFCLIFLQKELTTLE